jgi:hypothetical protein
MTYMAKPTVLASRSRLGTLRLSRGYYEHGCPCSRLAMGMEHHRVFLTSNPVPFLVIGSCSL